MVGGLSSTAVGGRPPSTITAGGLSNGGLLSTGGGLSTAPSPHVPNLHPELSAFLEATLLVPRAPEEAYRRFEALARRHVDTLRALTKRIQDARLKGGGLIHGGGHGGGHGEGHGGSLHEGGQIESGSAEKTNSAEGVEGIRRALERYDAALERYVPVLMAQARIYWERGHYPMVARILNQSAEFCGEHEVCVLERPVWF